MAGTLFGLGLSQRFDLNGRPRVGAVLKIYAAGTSTPSDTYADFSLSQLQPWPLETSADGTIPGFWVADGSYRARFDTSAGVNIFDEDSITAIGASSGSGGGDTTPAAAIFATGDVMWQPRTGTRTGWVRANARTIGSATSGATERANADCESLYLHLWSTYNNTLCPVTSGRGASAAADWAANKPIQTVDMRGRAPWGLDDMGNVSAGLLTGASFAYGDATTLGAAGGAATVVLAQANLPNVVLDVAISSGQGSHDHAVAGGDTATYRASSTGGASNVAGAGDNTTGAATLPAMTGTASLGGSATAVDKMTPFRLGSFYMRL